MDRLQNVTKLGIPLAIVATLFSTAVTGTYVVVSQLNNQTSQLIEVRVMLRDIQTEVTRDRWMGEDAKRMWYEFSKLHPDMQIPDANKVQLDRLNREKAERMNR